MRSDISRFIEQWCFIVPIVLLLIMAGCTTQFSTGRSAVAANPPTPPVVTGTQRVLIPTPSVAPAATVTATTSSNSLSPAQAQLLAAHPAKGVAPELQNETWLNSSPLALADLRGKVVIVEFWTFGCINCQRVIPYVRTWHEKYHDEGLVIIGVHTPEFAYERELTNVQNAVENLGVTWPVAIDNEWKSWRAYANRYWPAAYLIDKAGNIRHLAIGEGRYEYTESVIQALLAEPL